ALGGLHCAYDEVARSEQEEGVDCAGVSIQPSLFGIEQLDVVRTREGVGGKEHTKGEQLGEDEDPDGQVAGEAGPVCELCSAGRGKGMACRFHAPKSRQARMVLT